MDSSRDKFADELRSVRNRIESVTRPTFLTEDNREVELEISGRRYKIGRQIAEGDLSVIYEGEIIEGEGQGNLIIVKIIDDPEDNEFALNEIRVLKLLRDTDAPQLKHLPVFYDRFMTQGRRYGVILSRLDGYDLDFLRKVYPDGVPPEHVGWIFARILSAIGYAHSRGIVHCNLEPAHILVRPKDHNVFLADWSYAAMDVFESDAKFKVRNEAGFSAPEVEDGAVSHPSADLFSVGKCMIYLLGGDIETDEMYEDIDERLQNFIRYFVIKSASARAQEAWVLYRQLVELRKEIYGELRFREFEV
ncbi:protein kinase [Patescibacteria group bacterium]|nr:protein kinase [Patescibacteria group bacterium]